VLSSIGRHSRACNERDHSTGSASTRRATDVAARRCGADRGGIRILSAFVPLRTRRWQRYPQGYRNFASVSRPIGFETRYLDSLLANRTTLLRGSNVTSSTNTRGRRRSRVAVKSRYSRRGEGRECVEIARAFYRLLRRAPVRSGGGSFAVGRPLSFASRGGVFSVGIPVHFARGREAEPAGRAFCCLLDCAAEGLSAQRFLNTFRWGRYPMRSRSTPEAPLRVICGRARRRGRSVSTIAGTSDPSTMPVQSPAVSEPSDGPVREGHLRHRGDGTPARGSRCNWWKRSLAETT